MPRLRAVAGIIGTSVPIAGAFSMCYVSPQAATMMPESWRPNTRFSRRYCFQKLHNQHRTHRRPLSVSRVLSSSEQHEDEKKVERGGGSDDERLFWDIATQVLKTELDGQGGDLSRVWNFVAHNRDGTAPPPSSSSYRATGLYFPGLEARPWWGRSEFPWLEELENAAPDITREMKALAGAGGGRSYKGGTGEMSTVYGATEGWGTMRIRYMGRYDQPGINYTLLPRTLSVLRQLPLAPETAAFQRQRPGTGLPLHVDPSNFVLGCHLGVTVPPSPTVAARSPQGGLVEKPEKATPRRSGAGFGSNVSHPAREGGRTKRAGNDGNSGKGFAAAAASQPSSENRRSGSEIHLEPIARSSRASQRGRRSKEQGIAINSSAASTADIAREDSGGNGDGERAWMEVAGEKRSWKTGQAFVFDPSFLHRTLNPTSGDRVILNVDVWHPGLKEVERAAIQRVCELVEQWNARSGLFAS